MPIVQQESSRGPKHCSWSSCRLVAEESIYLIQNWKQIGQLKLPDVPALSDVKQHAALSQELGQQRHCVVRVPLQDVPVRR